MPIVSTVRGSFGPQGRFVGGARLGVGTTGGTITTAGGFRIHTFNYTGSTQTFTPDSAGLIDVLLVSGGGGGGGVVSGGGGGGGVLYATAVSVASQGYSIGVGNGGARNGWTGAFASPGGQGGTSSIGSLYSIIGGGGGRGRIGADDGSLLTGYNTGGGGYNTQTATAANPSGGFKGADTVNPATGNSLCGGGGGAGAVGNQGSGNTGGTGGSGVANSISGSSVTYGGGGGGSQYSGGLGGAGGSGGGGRGADSGGSPLAAVSGTDGLGGGGGGCQSSASLNISGAGGHGVVIVRYAI